MGKIGSFGHLNGNGMHRLIDDTDVLAVDHKRDDTRLVVLHAQRKLLKDIAICHRDPVRRNQVQLVSDVEIRRGAGREFDGADGHPLLIVVLGYRYRNGSLRLVNDTRIFLIQRERHDVAIAFEEKRTTLLIAACEEQSAKGKEGEYIKNFCFHNL